ncbi:MAG TPA: DNA gyrase inhibitor YacG [Terriglobales bacterium]|nr:DNA gyrase inhibitor YacG [Terriglobales bacterium]
MPRKKVLSLRCPTCRKLVLRDDPDFPFCSERCRLIDLGKWASGGYVISSPIADPEDIETLQREREEQQAHPKNKHDRNIH